MSDEKIDAYWFAGYEITPRADLREVKLRGANLYRADLRGANLRGANLRRADLGGADLREVKLREANLSGAINAVCLGYDQRGYRFVGIRHDGGWCISAGCRWFTMPQAIEHWTDKGNKDALARVAILQAH